jgi:type IV secretion system protein VirB5
MKRIPITLLIAMPVALTVNASPATAQGIPVYDASGYLQALATVSNTVKMIEQGATQITTMSNQLQSLQKLTNVNSIATGLINSTVRNILPSNAITATTLLAGDLSRLGSLGTQASQIQSRYGISASSSSSADAAYNQALRDATGTAATYAALGENTLSITQTRMQGLDQLRTQLDSAKDPKDVMDLQARIGVEQAQLQNDQIKLQAMQMAQSGQNQLALTAAVTTRARNASALYDANIIRK